MRITTTSLPVTRVAPKLRPKDSSRLKKTSRGDFGPSGNGGQQAAREQTNEETRRLAGRHQRGAIIPGSSPTESTTASGRLSKETKSGDPLRQIALGLARQQSTGTPNPLVDTSEPTGDEFCLGNGEHLQADCHLTEHSSTSARYHHQTKKITTNQLRAPHQRAIVADPSEHSVPVTADDPPVSLLPLCGQLLTLICILLVLLYLVDFAQRQMTNLLTKILGGVERRRSLATGSASSTSSMSTQPQTRQQAATPSLGVAQSQSSSTLNLPRNSSSSTVTATNSSGAGQRRTSRSSIHSLLGALTGAATAISGANNNGNQTLQLCCQLV